MKGTPTASINVLTFVLQQENRSMMPDNNHRGGGHDGGDDIRLTVILSTSSNRLVGVGSTVDGNDVRRRQKFVHRADRQQSSTAAKRHT